MMVVMPTLAESKYAKQEIVSALVASPEWLTAPKMTDRVDAPGHMMNQEYARQTTPQQARHDTCPGSRKQPAQCGGNQQAKGHPEGKQAAGRAQ